MKEILPRVFGQFPDVIFQFAGSEPPPELVHPNTEVLGFVSDLVWYIRRANVVIVPILSGGGMRTKLSKRSHVERSLSLRSREQRAEGIGQYQNLIRRDIKEFPNEICRVIREGCLKDETDFEGLRKAHSWGAVLGRLDRCVKELLGQTKGDIRR